jgi:hypothetical protein
MAEERYHKRNIAKSQLQTAVALFLSGRGRSSVITLAGAAGAILDRLVRNEGKEPFVDYACRIHREMAGYMPKRQSYSHHIDKQLGIIAHKHMGQQDSETIDLNLEKMACNALERAVADYVTLNGQEEGFIKAFLQWSWEHKDGPALMEAFKEVPAKLRPR